ncbi:MAG TPA: phytoene/squalene synthase family protein [Candidatus Paceibacterota bacterium]|nr:phytoene/squalene synthase family protein [Candidatus Paceibacterota bacterium]
MATPDLLTRLLRDVSRSFYRTLRVLPSGVRPQIGLAYLLARITDTIADTEIVSFQGRMAALDRLRTRIAIPKSGSVRLESFFAHAGAGQGSPAERDLLVRADEALGVLDSVEPGDGRLIRNVLRTIISGQELDLRRFRGASADRPAALESEEDLDDYTYRVAGCVGEFWTHLCRARLFPAVRVDEGFLLANGVRFGKGLQLVNILRDIPRDLRQGRCYLPSNRLAAHGLTAASLLDPRNMSRFLMLYEDYLDLAGACLADGWAYTNALPAGQMRVRLACAWPILIGLRTIARLRAGNVLDDRHRIKVSRREVKRLMLRSVCAYPWVRAWNRLFERARQMPASVL